MSTVKFTPNAKTTIVSLASMPGSEIEVRISLSVGEKRSIISNYKTLDKNDPESSKAIIDMIVMSIVKWNFVDDNNEPLQVTSELIDQLGDDEIKALSKAMGVDVDKAIAESKKKGE